MHVKFIARGTGSARAAAEYLLGERDMPGTCATASRSAAEAPTWWPPWPTHSSSSTSTPA